MSRDFKFPDAGPCLIYDFDFPDLGLENGEEARVVLDRRVLAEEIR